MDSHTQNRQPGHKGAQETSEQQKTRILSGFLNGVVEVRGIEYDPSIYLSNGK